MVRAASCRWYNAPSITTWVVRLGDRNGEKRTAGVTQDALRCGPSECVQKPMPALGRDDNEVRPLLIRHGQNRLGGVTAPHDTISRFPAEAVGRPARSRRLNGRRAEW